MAAVKKTVNKISEEKPVVSSNKKIKTNKKQLSFVVAALVAIFAFYLIKSFFIVAMVNNRPLWRFSVVNYLETQYGAEAYDTLLSKSLILREAKKQNISPSDIEIQTEIDAIKAQFEGTGQSFDEALELQGMTIKQLEENIYMKLVVEKLMADKVSVSDEEIANFVTENESFMGEMTEEEKQQVAREQLMQQKLSTEFQAFIADLKTNAKIKVFKQY